MTKTKCHSRKSGNPESLKVCLEIRSGSPIKDFGDDSCAEFGDDKESNRQECLFYTEKKDEEILRLAQNDGRGAMKGLLFSVSLQIYSGITINRQECL